MAMAQAILTDLRNRLTELYGPRIDRLLLFGSQARGDAVDGSDVDVLVVLHGDVLPEEESRRTGKKCTTSPLPTPTTPRSTPPRRSFSPESCHFPNILP